MSIDFQLPVALLDQLHDQTTDGFPAENEDMDCVPTSIASGLMGLRPGSTYDGDGVLDAVYGEGYTGGTGASAFVDFCAQQGVHLYSVDGSSPTLVALLHSLIHQGKPTLITMPGQWNNPAFDGANPGPVSHVCLACGDGPGMLRLMNPWGGFWHDVSDAWMARQLAYGQIWPMEVLSMVPTVHVLRTFGGEIPPDVGFAKLASNLGLQRADLLALGNNARDFAGYDDQASSVQGMQVAVPGYDAAAKPVPTPPPVPGTDRAAAAKAALQAWLAE